MSIEAMKQALEALEKTRDENATYLNFKEPYHEAITALRTAIEQAEDAVAEEREACAKACEAIERNGAWVTKQEAAAAIRARS